MSQKNIFLVFEGQNCSVLMWYILCLDYYIIHVPEDLYFVFKFSWKFKEEVKYAKD